MKKCIYCKKEQDLELFYSDSSKKYGRSNACINCFEQKRRAKPKLEFNITVTTLECTICNKIKDSSEFHKNKRRPSGLAEQCKDCRRFQTKTYYNKNKEVIKEKTNTYYHTNKQKLRPNRNKYQRDQMKDNPLFVLSRRLRNRLYYALEKKAWAKNTHFSQYIGCSLEDLKVHIEKQFVGGMSWLNQGTWHIDHVLPLSSAKTPEEMYKLCHYSNLQPLWAVDNLSKGAKV